MPPNVYVWTCFLLFCYSLQNTHKGCWASSGKHCQIKMSHNHQTSKTLTQLFTIQCWCNLYRTNYRPKKSNWWVTNPPLTKPTIILSSTKDFPHFTILLKLIQQIRKSIKEDLVSEFIEIRDSFTSLCHIFNLLPFLLPFDIDRSAGR